MATNDFYLSFGSNAGQWAKGLAKELKPVTEVVQALIADLDKLNGTTATPKISRLNGGTGPETPPASGGGATSVPEIASGAQEMAQHLASSSAELDRFMSTLGSMVARMGQAGDAFQAAVKKQNYSIGQQLRHANPETASLRDASGNFANAESRGLVDPKGKPIGQQPATIPGTARVLVDEAAFNRVVQAVERNVDATRAVEQAIDRLNARGGLGAPNGVAPELEAQVKAQVAAALAAATSGNTPPARTSGTQASAADSPAAESRGAELRALEAETAEIKVDTEDRKKTRAEKKAANQAAVQPGLPAQDRVDRRRDLDLAGSEEVLRSLQKRDLQRIAGTFSAEGYNTPSNTKTTNDQFVQAILASRQRFDAAGGVTKNDLSVSESSKVVATEVPKAVRPLVDAILKAAQLLQGEEGAYATRRLDRLTGGQDTRLRDAAGRERIQRGDVQRGAAFGGDLNEVISKAEQTIAARNERISNAAINQGLRLTERPGYNPYTPEYREGIQGRGQEAVDARFGLGKLIAATEAIDKVGAEVIQLDGRLKAAQQALAGMNHEADAFAGKQKLSADEVARYTQLLLRIPQQQARVEAHQARIGDIAGSEAFLTPEFRQGLQARRESQQAYAAEREALAARRALDQQTDPREAAKTAFFGAGQAGARLLPGIRETTGPNRQFAFTQDLEQRDPAGLDALNKAFSKYTAAVRDLQTPPTHLEMAPGETGPVGRKVAFAGDPNDPKKVVDLDRKMRERLHEVVQAYEQATGAALPTGEFEGLRTYGRVEQTHAVEQELQDNRVNQAAEARQRRTLRDNGANLVDPASLTAESLRADYARQQAARQRLGGTPGRVGSEALTGPSTVAERDARELASARETLAKSGVRFSQTLNSSLNGAKTLEDLLKRLNAAIREGTLQISAYHPRSRTEPEVIGSYTDVAAKTGNFGADPTVLHALEESIRTRAAKPAPAAARAEAAPAVSPAQDDAFTEANQLRNQIEQRRRLVALRKELARTQAGDEVDPALFAKAAAGSKTFTALGAKTGYTGEDYQARIQKAIGSLTEDLKGVPRIRQLEAQLTDAITRTGTSDGRRPTADSGSGGRGSSGGGGTTAGAAAPGGGGRNDDRIVQVLNAIHATIKAGIKITPTRPGDRKAPVAKAEPEPAPTKAVPAAAARVTQAETAQTQAEQALTKARQDREQVQRQVAQAMQATQEQRANLAAAKQTRIQAQGATGPAVDRALELRGQYKAAPDSEAATRAYVDALKQVQQANAAAAAAVRAEAEAATNLRAVSGPLAQARKAETDAEANLRAATAALAKARLAAAGPATAATPGARPAIQYSTQAKRDSFVAGLEPKMQALVGSEDKVGAAAALVTKGILNQTDALAFFRSELDLDTKAAVRFADELRTKVGDDRLDASARAESRRQANLDKLPAGGDPKAVAAAHAQGAQNDQLANTTDKLSAATVKEIANLKNLVTESAEATKVGEQMARVYAGMSRDLGGQGFSAPQVKQRAKGVFEDAGLKVGGGELRDVAQVAKAAEPDLKAQGEQIGVSVREAAGKALFNQGFWNRVIHSTGTFIVRNFTAGFVFGLTNALQQALSQAIETEAAFVKVSSSLEATGRSTTGLRTDLQQISTDYGVALHEVYETTANLVGLFNTPLELAGAARVVAQLQLISRGALNAQEATSSLASITASFGQGDGVQGLQHIADVLTVIQERVGVNIENTAEGVARMAGLAQQVGLSFEETSVFVGEIAKKTGQTGGAAGEQFSRILATLQTGRGRSVLQDVFRGKDTGIEAALAARQYGDVLKIVMANYQGLTKAQQDNIAVTLGGQRQAAAINALLSDGAQTLNTLTAAEDAHGQAAERAQQIQQVLNAQIAKFGQNITNAVSNILRSGIAASFVLLLELVNKLLGGVNTVFSTINSFAEGNPLIGFLQHTTLGMVGLAIAIIAVRKALSGLRDAFKRGGGEGIANLLGGGLGGGEATETLFSSSGTTENNSSDRAKRRSEVRAEARDEARIRREVAQSEQGTVRGALSSYYEGGALRAQARQQALLASAEAQRVRREAAVQQRADFADQRSLETIGLTPGQRLARSGRVAGAGASNILSTPVREAPALFASGLGRIPGVARTAELATRGAAKTMSGLGSIMTGMSAAAGPATAAVGAFAIGLLYLGQEWDKQKAFAKQAKDAKDAVFGPDAGKSQDQIDKERYVGPSTTIRDKVQENSQTFMGGLGILGDSYLAQFSLKNLLTGGLANQTFANIFLHGGDQGKKLTGELPDKYQKDDTTAQRSYDELAKQHPVGYGQIPFAPGYRGRKDPLAQMTKSQAGQISDILKAQESANAVLKEASDKADADKSLSDQQRVAYNAHLEQIRLDNASITQSMILKVQGLGDVNALTLEQIQQADEVVSSISGLSGGTAKDYELAIQTAIKDVGSPQGSHIKPLLDKLGKGGLTQVESLKTTLGITRAEADAAQAEYVSLQAAGADQKDVDAARAAVFQKIAAVDQIAQQIIQAEIQAAQDLATFFVTRGDYNQANSALTGLVAQLQAEAFKPGVAQDKQISLLNQADQVQQQMIQNRVDGLTRADRLTAANAPDAVTKSGADLAASKKKLDALQAESARSGKLDFYGHRQAVGVTPQQLDDASADYTTKLRANKDAIQAAVQAGYAVQAAQLLGGVAKAQNDHARALNQLSYVEKTFPKSSAEYKDALANAISSGQALTQSIQDQTQSLFQLETAQTNDPVSKAGIGIQSARNQVAFALATYKKGSKEYNDALASLWGAREAYAQAEASQRAGTFAVRAAATLNAVAKAQVEEAAARDAYNTAVAAGDKTAADSALAQLIGAQQATRAARQEEAAAARETKVTSIAPGDAVAIARQRVANAKAAQADARQFGTSSTQYQQATQQVIEAVRSADDAVQQVLAANSNLAVALAEAAGKTVDAARQRYAEARKEWLIALTKSGGRQTADVKNAKAAEVQAGAAYRDAQLQDKLDTIDFNQQMGTITAQGAIAALQKILRATNLTQQQRRELMLKIKGMQNDLRSSLTGSGFNIPDEIKLPTPYEVRRSLGVDKYLKRVKDTVSTAIGFNPSSSTLTAKALSLSAAPGAIAPTTSGASSSSVVAALDSVRQAVVANGAQVTNDIAITNQVATPAMVDAIAKKVVELISTSTAMGARANQASPKLVTY